MSCRVVPGMKMWVIEPDGSLNARPVKKIEKQRDDTLWSNTYRKFPIVDYSKEYIEWRKFSDIPLIKLHSFDD